MAKRLFVDTVGWMAMADSADPAYLPASEVRDRWLEDGNIWVTTNYVLDESLTLIRIRLGLDAAQAWWNMVSQGPRCRLEWITPEHVEKASHWFFSWKDQSFSFTDCTSFVVMKDLHLDVALTTDRHFLIAGFQILP